MADQLNETTAALAEIQQSRPRKGRFKVLLIRAGWGSSGYYSEAVLKRDGPAIWPEGTHMYLNHPTQVESMDRPEGDVQNWASVLTSTPVWDSAERGLVAEVQVFPQWRGLLNEEFAAKVGLSIRASGRVEYGEAEGREGPIVTSLDEGISVDWVTRAGAGGRVLALIESARAEGEYLRIAAEAKAPPFKRKDADDDADDGKKPDDADQDTEDAEDEDEDLPAFLKKKKTKAKVSEARNVGHWLESRLHAAFTNLADDMFGEGRLTRDERTALSSAVGDGLTAFSARVEADCPHLYQRDLWDNPEPAQAAMAETETKGAPVSGSTEKQTPPDREATTEVTESAREKGLTAQLAEATKAAETAQRALAEAQAATADRIAALEAKIAEGDAEKLRLNNERHARKACAEALKDSALPASSHGRVTESVIRAIPTADDGALDLAKLDEAIKAAIDDKRAELAEAFDAAGLGTVRGLGESARADVSEADIDKHLAETFAGIGLDERAAVTAAQGRA